jgi:hypothetical protein
MSSSYQVRLRETLVERRGDRDYGLHERAYPPVILECAHATNGMVRTATRRYVNYLLLGADPHQTLCFGTHTPSL